MTWCCEKGRSSCPSHRLRCPVEHEGPNANSTEECFTSSVHPPANHHSRSSSPSLYSYLLPRTRTLISTTGEVLSTCTVVSTLTLQSLRLKLIRPLTLIRSLCLLQSCLVSLSDGLSTRLSTCASWTSRTYRIQPTRFITPSHRSK